MSYDSWSPQLWENESNKIIRLCQHCEDEILKTKNLCDNCSTKAKREEMHRANAEIIKNYTCKVCARLMGKVFEKKAEEKPQIIYSK